FMSTAMGFMHVPQNISAAISMLDLSPYQLILILTLFYIVLGSGPADRPWGDVGRVGRQQMGE
ncbi:hypothetical protein KTN05_16445, partial [Paracoccus sp. Z118]